MGLGQLQSERSTRTATSPPTTSTPTAWPIVSIDALEPDHPVQLTTSRACRSRSPTPTSRTINIPTIRTPSRLTHTDGNGHTTSYTYDGNGNLTVSPGPAAQPDDDDLHGRPAGSSRSPMPTIIPRPISTTARIASRRFSSPTARPTSTPTTRQGNVDQDHRRSSKLHDLFVRSPSIAKPA